MENKLLVEVNDLVVEYIKEKSIVHAVNGVSFSLRKGETLGLVGETGAGKTTIAKSIMRILPDNQAVIRKGRILLEGRDLLECSESEMLKIRGSEISMIFQDPMTSLNPVSNVGHQIAEAIRLHNDVSKQESAIRADEMLEMVGIPKERAKEYPHQFSGGMKQRVVIAMALACNPRLILADEPTTALDVTIQAQVMDMILRLKNERNTSMILITHDLGIVAENCDSVAIVYAGEIVERGTKEEIFDDPRHPYTIGLFGALPDLSKNESRLHSIPGLPPDPASLPPGCHFSPRCPYANEKCRHQSPADVCLGGSHICKCHMF